MRTTKNMFRKLATEHGLEARYSGKQKMFYLRRTCKGTPTTKRSDKWLCGIPEITFELNLINL
ncbi:hypothetical protein LCGC14_1649910 [marine sediment metagenome]|uniref:Uncharacterized protein n=1 Tax=marine sediment metagenome TaxID=412755 RepID=A0A0F9HX67_9ZZZZ